MDSLDYDFDEEAPRYRKKSKKRHVRSDHKHEYEQVCIDAHTVIHRHGERVPYLHVGERCRICGRMANWSGRTDLQEPPKGMPFYVVPDWTYLWDNKILPDEKRVR